MQSFLLGKEKVKKMGVELFKIKITLGQVILIVLAVIICLILFGLAIGLGGNCG